MSSHFTQISLCGPLLTDGWVGNIRLQRAFSEIALFGLNVTKQESSSILSRLNNCGDVQAELIWNRRGCALMMWGKPVEDVVREVFDAIDQMPKHGNLLLYAITAVYNPLLPLVTGDPNARIPRSLAEFAWELVYPLYQRAWYIVYNEFLPNR